MIKILCETNFCESIWCKRILEGITTAFKKKRKKNIVVLRDDSFCVNKDDSVILVGSDDGWINEKIEICNGSGCVPIVVCNQLGRTCKGKYHCVTADIENSVNDIYSYLTNKGCNRAVFYGLNESSASDKGRAKCFLSLFQNNGFVIKNNGRIEDAFNELSECIDSIDAVICANDLVAVHLVKRLMEIDKNLLNRIIIVSCAKTILSTSYSPYILSQVVDFVRLGEVSAELYEFVVDRSYISDVTLNIKCSGFESDITRTDTNSSASSFKSDDAFYKDEIILSALKIDSLLSDCKDDDLRILRSICLGKTYTQIADECFMSESTVKYHVKKYSEALGLKGRDELEKALQVYMI